MEVEGQNNLYPQLQIYFFGVIHLSWVIIRERIRKMLSQFLSYDVVIYGFRPIGFLVYKSTSVT